MEKHKKNNIELYVLIIVTILLVGLLIFSAVKLKMKENNSGTKLESSTINNSSSSEKETEEEIGSKPAENIGVENTTNSNANINNSSTSKEEDKSENNIVSTPKPTDSPKEEKPSDSDTQGNIPAEETNEEVVVTYLRNLESESFSSNDISFKDKAKNAFVTVVDFLFYGSEIKGYTFSELTTSAKLKVIQIALSVDNKIDEYFPDYKETIKEKMSNLKAKAALLYLEQTAKICSSENMAASCEIARENFKDMKESFGFTWDLIKTGASTSYEKLKVILGEWYQSIK